MAMFINRIKAFFRTVPGHILLGCLYGAMLLLVLMFYTGEGAFIYEAF